MIKNLNALIDEANAIIATANDYGDILNADALIDEAANIHAQLQDQDDPEVKQAFQAIVFARSNLWDIYQWMDL